MYEKDSTNNMIYMPSQLKWIPMSSGNKDYQKFLQYLADEELTLDDINEYGS